MRKKESHSVTAADAAAEKPIRRRNSAATRARIMAVATREFANKGYEGAGTDEIADRASINKRMIYHYFSSKEQLYLAVLELPLRKPGSGAVRFRPRFFAGLGKGGKPRWSRSERKAVPLALDGVTGGSPHGSAGVG